MEPTIRNLVAEYHPPFFCVLADLVAANEGWSLHVTELPGAVVKGPGTRKITLYFSGVVLITGVETLDEAAELRALVDAHPGDPTVETDKFRPGEFGIVSVLAQVMLPAPFSLRRIHWSSPDGVVWKKSGHAKVGRTSYMFKRPQRVVMCIQAPVRRTFIPDIHDAIADAIDFLRQLALLEDE